ncbi:hypothetical protein KQ944_18395 [Bacillus subtilis]|uniref:hypothetical protein n=1 Tax=Pseudochrobactrum asaccharolyticum TaxID=354351 RepID=UPI001F366231|nr:hypothetical protein [Pseudochrobactrum asaccharolyticum]MCF7647320.1 hypothetical protein [Pseudochrobactrum asaccharolyticum]MCF7673611.1 hypothetical protein [Bacillus subtilis]
MVDVPYHTHVFDIPTASEGEIRTGVESGKAITPDKLFPVLAEKANKATTLAGYGITDAATKQQGQKADTAVQPGQVSAVGFSGRYADLLNKPNLGDASTMNVGTTVGTVAAGDDARIVGAVQKVTTVTAGAGLAGGGALATNIALALSSTSLASLALANTAVQPARKLSAGAGLTGGGDFSADRTVALNAASIASLGKADTAVQPARKLSAGAGLSGGGDFSADRTVALNAASITSLAKADSAVQPLELGALAKKDKITTTDISATGSTSNGALLTQAGIWVDPSGGGDMFRQTYDPTNKAADAFDMANMDEAENAKIMTAEERAKLAGIPADADKTPALATVATTGDYKDLVNKPAIPPAQVQSDWNAASGVTAIQNKPDLGTAAATNVEAFATADQGDKADNAVRFDAQALTAQEQGQARANIDVGILSGWRNKLINGDFRIAFRGVAFTIPANNGAYTADRWGVINTTNAQLIVEVVNDFNFGHALSFRFDSEPTSGEVTLIQKVENVRSLPSGEATFTLDMLLENSMRVFIYGEQNFGTSGSSLNVIEISNSVEPSGANFKRKSTRFTVGSLEGKLANPGDSTFNIAVQFHPRNIGFFFVGRASLVEGDATAEKDPFSPRHRQQEVAMTQRYYCYLDRLEMFAQGGVSDPTFGRLGRAFMPVNMRTTPTVFIGKAFEYNVRPTIFAGSTSGVSFNGVVRESHNWGMIENLTFDAEFPL